MTTLEDLRERLSKYGGLLRAGKHQSDCGIVCGVELLRDAMDDDPEKARIYDVRRLNDIDVPDEVRTGCLLPVLAAYAGCRDWPIDRQRAVVERIVIDTVRLIVAELPRLTQEVAAQCRAVTTIDDVVSAAKTARLDETAWEEAGFTTAGVQSFAVEERIAWAEAAALAASVTDDVLSALEKRAAFSGGAAAPAADAWAKAESAAAREHVFCLACGIWLEAAERIRDKEVDDDHL